MCLQIISAIRSSLCWFEMVVLRQDRFIDGFLHLDHPCRQVRDAHQVGADLYLSPAFRSCDLSRFIDPPVRLQTGRPAGGAGGDAQWCRRLCSEGSLNLWQNLKKTYQNCSKYFSYIHSDGFECHLKCKELLKVGRMCQICRNEGILSPTVGSWFKIRRKKKKRNINQRETILPTH